MAAGAGLIILGLLVFPVAASAGTASVEYDASGLAFGTITDLNYYNSAYGYRYNVAVTGTFRFRYNAGSEALVYIGLQSWLKGWETNYGNGYTPRPDQPASPTPGAQASFQVGIGSFTGPDGDGWYSVTAPAAGVNWTPQFYTGADTVASAESTLAGAAWMTSTGTWAQVANIAVATEFVPGPGQGDEDTMNISSISEGFPGKSATALGWGFTTTPGTVAIYSADHEELLYETVAVNSWSDTRVVFVVPSDIGEGTKIVRIIRSDDSLYAEAPLTVTPGSGSFWDAAWDLITDPAAALKRLFIPQSDYGYLVTQMWGKARLKFPFSVYQQLGDLRDETALHGYDEGAGYPTLTFDNERLMGGTVVVALEPPAAWHDGSVWWMAMKGMMVIGFLLGVAARYGPKLTT